MRRRAVNCQHHESRLPQHRSPAELQRLWPSASSSTRELARQVIQIARIHATRGAQRVHHIRADPGWAWLLTRHLPQLIYSEEVSLTTLSLESSSKWYGTPKNLMRQRHQPLTLFWRIIILLVSINRRSLLRLVFSNGLIITTRSLTHSPTHWPNTRLVIYGRIFSVAFSLAFKMVSEIDMLSVNRNLASLLGLTMPHFNTMESSIFAGLDFDVSVCEV